MFRSLSDKLISTISKLRGNSTLTAAHIEVALKEVNIALLEADVHFKVVKEFCANVLAKATGEAVLKGLNPAQQVIKIVHEELVTMMGSATSELNIKVAPPAIILLAGLQGSGKTTTAGKLAAWLKKEHKRTPYLVPADVYRPAAIDQLKTLAAQLNIPCYPTQPTDDPVQIAQLARIEAAGRGYDTIIIDTAGRLQIDNELMKELVEIAEAVDPHETLLVVDAMTGQEAVNVAKAFDEALDIDGVVLTKLDGDTRGGAALSMRSVLGKPIKLIGTSEKMDGLEQFHPDRMASRILGMGDVLTLIEKTLQETDEAQVKRLEKKFKKNQLDLEDFLEQLRMMQKMGGVASLAGMLPGMGKMAEKIDPEKAEKELKRVEAIILSMTPDERRDPDILSGQRKKRISKGSGTSPEQVNTLLKQFNDMKKMMAQLNKMMGGGAAGVMKMMKGLGGGLGGLGGLGKLGGMFK